MSRVPLSILDLVPISSGSTASAALANTVDLARRAEAHGYVRYWVAEHHLNPGVAGTAPPIVMTLIAGATSRIRVGSGAVQMGHQTPLAIVEQFGLLDAAFPGRIDLGLGRSGALNPTGGAPTSPREAPAWKSRAVGADGHRRTARGLVIPKPVSLAALLKSPRFRAQKALLQQPEAKSPPYTEQVETILALIGGDYRNEEGVDAHAVPGEGAGVEVWITGSSGGESATLAGRLGLPFAANYHVAPAAILDAVAAYRAAFQPSASLREPHVMVSADVVVAPDDETARWLATAYGLWVHSIRSGAGAFPFPPPEEASEHQWTEEDRSLVADRIATQFVGSPDTVTAVLEVLVSECGADELLVTTITHDHADRVRSLELLAERWCS
jgi:alkanesulfonate monooxygenase SsuD/methylene tetrahydromethanopterin reductase-like flavin-dependent oxidoreductase (luciferase family)